MDAHHPAEGKYADWQFAAALADIDARLAKIEAYLAWTLAAPGRPAMNMPDHDWQAHS